MKRTIIIELHEGDEVPKRPVLIPGAIAVFKKIHLNLQSIAIVVVRKEESESVKALAFPESAFFPKSRFKKNDL